MKQFSYLPKLLILFVALGLFITSCGPDPIDPTVDFVDEAGFLSSDATVAGGSIFKVKISADKGSADMNTLTIQKDGANLSTADYTIDGSIDNNPKLLIDADRSSFTYEVEITAPTTGSSTYSFIVDADDAGTTSASIEISIEDADPVLVNGMNASIELDNPGTVQIVLSGTKGGSQLKSIAVYEEGTIITDLTRLTWGTTPFADNPNPLEGADKDGFTDAKLFLKSNNVVGTTNYTITLTDENDKESSVPYAITIKPIATPITDVFTDVLIYNNDGPNFGAIDLETGTNVSSTNAAADIVDLGLDDVTGDWLQAIKPNDANTTLNSIDAAYTYDNVTSRELLIDAFNSGTSLAETGSLVVGSTYAAKKGDVYYLLTVTNVNVTTGNNLDSMTFNIKKSE